MNKCTSEFNSRNARFLDPFLALLLLGISVLLIKFTIGEAAIVSEDPIYHNLTRAGWAAPCPEGGISYGYTTLEGYNRSEIENQYLIINKRCDGEIITTKVGGSAEGRTIFQIDEHSLLIGSSLNPKLIRYEEVSGLYTEVSRERPAGMWIHQFFADGEYAYIKLSMPSANESLGKIIYKINLVSGEKKEIPFNCNNASNGYSGIQTVDTLGRIWVYAAYPVKYYWILPSSQCEPRIIDQNKDHKILSWLEWRGKSYYVTISPSGKFNYLPFGGKKAPAILGHLSGVLPADLFKTKGNRIETNIFVDSTGHIYRCDNSKCRRVSLPLVFSRIEVPDNDNEIRPRGITFIHDQFGPVEMVYAKGKKFIFWIIDTKKFLDVTEGETEFITITDATRNATPANLTSLVSLGPTHLLTSGYLTSATLASVDTKTGKSSEFDGAVPFSQGQVNYILEEESGLIIGSVYPYAVYFIYDPSKPWSPGQLLDSNPFNFGPLRNHSQQRTYHGFSDRNGMLWFLSKSDFSSNEVYAISKIDIQRRSITTINTTDHKIPIPLSVTDYDASRIILIGRNSKNTGIYLMKKENFEFSYVDNFTYNIVASVSNVINGISYNIITGDSDVYYFDEQSGLKKAMSTPGPVLKLVAEGNYIFLIGEDYISMIDLRFPYELQTRFSWMYLRSRFFKDTHWMPAKIDVLNKKFYFADEFKLHSVEIDFEWNN